MQLVLLTSVFDLYSLQAGILAIAQQVGLSCCVIKFLTTGFYGM